MVNCLRNVQNIRKNVYDIIICPIYHKIKADRNLIEGLHKPLDATLSRSTELFQGTLNGYGEKVSLSDSYTFKSASEFLTELEIS